MSAPEVTTETTVVGRIRLLRVDGSWTETVAEAMRREACQGVKWRLRRPGRRTSCRPLVEFAEHLQYLSIWSKNPIDDTDIGEMRGLVGLECVTSGTQFLDLNGLTRLRHLVVDDRKAGLRVPSPFLESVVVYRNQRKLVDFERSETLTSLVLEGVGGAPVDLAGQLPRLEQLRVVNHHVPSFEGLLAPSLKSLYIDSQDGPAQLDLAPLAFMPALEWLYVRGPKSMVNVAAVADHPRLRMRWDPKIRISPSEERLLPEEWIRANRL